MNTLFRNFKIPVWSALFGAMLVGQAHAATTPGVVSLTAKLSDYTGSTSALTLTRHDTVAWVTTDTGTFIKTLWSQGPADLNHKDWKDHFAAFTTARAGSTALDGYTSATALDYSAPNSPVSLTWNCKDASNNLVPDGNYLFFLQYSENQSATQGPVTTGLAWTKGPAPSTVTPPAQGTQGSPLDGNNFTEISIVWTPGTIPPAITSTAPPAGTQGLVYNHAITKTGSAPITFAVISGALPDGLSLGPDGVISGTPTVAGTFSGAISVENGLLPNATQPFSIAIAQGIAFTNAVPGNGNPASSFNHTCTVIGTAPVTFTVDSGSLPPGLALSADGVISGKPTTLGTFTGKIRARNGLASDVTQDFSILISPATNGMVNLTATISDYAGATTTGQLLWHDTVVWVTTASGKFIKTLWKQGPADWNHKDWYQHHAVYTSARAGSTAIDGFTSATAVNYLAPNNPVSVTWNCRDAAGNLVDDGDYQFWIQYCERQNLDGLPAQGPVTTGLAWTKGTSASIVYPADQGTQGAPVNGNNFTNMSISWSLAPDIAVVDPGAVELLAGEATDMGSVVIDTLGAAETFTIKNVGSAALTIPSISVSGAAASDFIVSAPTVTTLAPDASATFTVTFRPAELGTRSATLRIATNDFDESSFNIELTGTGTPPPAPEIVVQQPAGSSLVDGKSKKSFGTVKVGSSSNTKTFTIKNTGTAPLTGLKVLKSSNNSNEFIVGAMSANSLNPGKFATFKVLFKPKKKGSRSETIYIKSNDADECPFSIKLMGEGAR